MTIVTYKNHKCEVLDTYETGSEKKAVVRALEGDPFMGGDKWPVRTSYGIVPVTELQPITQEPKNGNGKSSLLDLALDQERPVWETGEVVWIWGDHHKGAFLKNNGSGHVFLYLAGRREHCPIFWLDPEKGWEVVPTVNANYRQWCEAVK